MPSGKAFISSVFQMIKHVRKQKWYMHILENLENRKSEGRRKSHVHYPTPRQSLFFSMWFYIDELMQCGQKAHQRFTDGRCYVERDLTVDEICHQLSGLVAFLIKKTHHSDHWLWVSKMYKIIYLESLGRKLAVLLFPCISAFAEEEGEPCLVILPILGSHCGKASLFLANAD